MFHDLDETLKKMLDDMAAPAELRGADVSFVTPDKNFAPNQNTVNLFLHEVKENRELRDPVPIIERQGGLFSRKRPPLRVDCSYLLTAWGTAAGPARVVEEHRLLGQALVWLSRFPTIPDTYFSGSLVGQPFPPPTLVAQMDGIKNTSEFWSALSVPPRPYFIVLVTIAMELGKQITEGPPVVTKDMRLLVLGAPASEERWIQIGGRVFEAANPNKAIPEAQVRLVERDESATTNAEGHFTFSMLTAGNYTLQVSKAGFASRSKNIVVPGTSLDAYEVGLTP